MTHITSTVFLCLFLLFVCPVAAYVLMLMPMKVYAHTGDAARPFAIVTEIDIARLGELGDYGGGCEVQDIAIIPRLRFLVLAVSDFSLFVLDYSPLEGGAGGALASPRLLHRQHTSRAMRVMCYAEGADLLFSCGADNTVIAYVRAIRLCPVAAAPTRRLCNAKHHVPACICVCISRMGAPLWLTWLTSQVGVHRDAHGARAGRARRGALAAAGAAARMAMRIRVCAHGDAHSRMRAVLSISENAARACRYVRSRMRGHMHIRIRRAC